MQINLSFISLEDLQEFVDWASKRGASTNVGELTIKMDASEIRKAIDETLADLRSADTRPITAEGAVIPTEAGQSAQEAASATAGEAPKTDPAPETASKRKRRTKAEIAADEAAAKAAQEAADVAELRAGVEQGLKAALMGGELVSREDSDKAFEPLAKIAAALPTISPLDNLKPEPNGLTPSPEIVALAATIDGSDKMAHMNEGRDFIAKHGFPKYNETFALADVSTNIAAHTPEQAAMHRAAMQWLIAQADVK